MFGSMRKKRRQPPQPLTAATADPNAATAAAAVFGRHGHESNNSLSSAAAAAALRARPTTPINVGEVQTKRTMRRSASQSSNGSSFRGDQRRSMQRSPSQSSMTERTFRSPSPSPHRAAASAASGYDEPPPPVPSIPDGMRNDDGRATTSRPSVNLYTQPFRVASQKKKDGAGSWFGAAAEGDASNIRTSDAVLRTATTAKPTDPRAGAVSPSLSINFSYPRGAQAISPPASPVFERTPSVTQSQRYVAPRRANSNATADQPLVYDPNSRRMVPRQDITPVEHDVREASGMPVRKKKTQQHVQQQQVQQPQLQPQYHSGVSRSGSHLAKGSVARIKGTAVDSPESTPKSSSPKPSSPSPQQQPQHQHQSRPVESPEPKTLHHPPPVEVPQAAPQSPEPVETSPAESDQPTMTKDVRRTDGATILPHPGTLGDREPAIQEESDEEELNRDAPAPSRFAADSDEDEEDEDEPVRSAPSPKPSPPVQLPTLSTSSTMVEGPAGRHTPSPASILKHHGSVRGAREASNSPVRTPRFAVTPDQLVVRHEPPPRSVSPRKSALKHSTSPSRGASPSGDESETSAFASVNGSEDPVVQRKKSHRVSFDDQSIKVIGEGAQDQHADSPIVPSPQQARRPWYSNIGKSKKKDTVGLDEDEVMKPRPALPMFGSVRDKKPRDTEERPLVRPADTTRSPLSGTPTKFPSSPDDEVDDPVGQSSDHNVGAILNQDLSNRNEANTSRYREPLPPVVTSMEGSGYYSPSSASSSDDESDADAVVSRPRTVTVKEPEPTLPAEQVKEEILADTAAANGSARTDHPVTQTIETIPTISVIQPSPRFPDHPESVDERSPQAGYFDVPGGFPDDESDNVATAPAVKLPEVQALPNKSAQSEPRQEAENGGDMPSPPVAKAPHVATIDEESEASSGDSIYSDAYEDLSDVDGDGFMSLDAVLTTPIREKASQKLVREALVGAAVENRNNKASSAADTTHKDLSSGPPKDTADDWEKAKLYWKGLTIEKRKQLEQEAIHDAGIEADREVVESEPKRTKKKKTMRTDPAPEPKAPKQHLEVDPGRVYQIKPGTRAVSNVEDPFVPGPSHKAQQSEPVSGKLRKSMRGAHQPDNAGVAAETRMPRTLRSSGQDDSGSQRTQGHESAATASVGMRKSLRQNGAPQQSVEQQTRVTKAPRPVSLPQPPREQQTTSRHKKRATLDSSAAAQAMVQPTLVRRGSDSSESSFKRVRAPRQGFGFRSSMRASSTERPSTAGRNSRFSLRSLSPTPASPPVAMGNRMSMRSTLRSDSSDGSTRRMRIPGFGKNKAEKSKERRYDDSSDDDVHIGRSTQGSRFVDSSDEDEPVAALPSSGGMASKTMRNGGASSSAAAAAIRSSNSRRQMRSDSPDLPDSDDEEPPQALPQRTASGRLSKPIVDGQGLQRKRSGRGELLTSPSAAAAEAPVRPSHSRRGSFFSVLRRKKDKDAGKISRPDVRESAVRQGTKLERSEEELNALRNTSPKLQKRSASNNWPLPDKADEDKRPATATQATAPPPLSGIPKAGFKRRSLSYQGVDSKQAAMLPRHDDDSIADAQSQVDGSVKKKKFGKLRKMFGLHD